MAPSLGGASAPSSPAPQVPFDEEMTYYNRSAVEEPVARLQKRINQDEVTLGYDPAYGYLLSVLEELKVPQSSQLLVFSRTPFSLKSHADFRHHAASEAENGCQIIPQVVPV